MSISWSSARGALAPCSASFRRSFPGRSIKLTFFPLLVGVLLAVALMNSLPAAAQVSTATISGIVTDSTGAIIPNVSVTVEDMQTGVKRVIMTNTVGRYTAPELVIGQYKVEAKEVGFQTQVRSNITLTVGAQAVVDITMQVGKAEEVVNVSANTAGVEVTSSEMSSLVDDKQMRDLPLNGRDFEQLILLTPGVQPVSSGTLGSTYGRNASYSIAGYRPTGQAILLDGSDIQGFWGHGAGSPMTGNSLGVEAIAEFTTLTNSYGAQFGGSGSVINSVTKSGTNSFHGSAFDYLRNSKLDALNYFDNPASPPVFRRNQFGGSLGGPIKKDKAFFFADYEGVRQLLGTTSFISVPDANARLGIINGTTYSVSPAVQPYLAIYPGCSPAGQEFAASGTCQYITETPQPTNEDYVNARIDHHWSANDTFFARYVYDSGSFLNTLGIGLPGWPEVDASRNQYLALGDTRMFSSTLINTIRFDFVRNHATATSPTNNPLLTFFPGRENGAVTVTGIASFGTNKNLPLLYGQNKFAEADDLMWSHHAHQVKIGAEVKRIQSNFASSSSLGGLWTFTSLASFLQDLPSSFAGAPAGLDNAERGFREIDFAPYIQDDWKVTRKLTLNLGLRYEFMTNPVEVHNLLANITNFVTSPGFTPVSSVFATNPSLKNLDPRIGFAWDLFGDHKSSIRAGFGMYHDLITPREYGQGYGTAGPYVLATQRPAPPFPGGFSTTVASPHPSQFFNVAYPSTSKTPYALQYNLSIQRELSAATMLTAGYVGSSGVDLMIVKEFNPPAATQLPNGSWYAATPRVAVNPNLSFMMDDYPGGHSSYNSLQINLKHNYSKSVEGQVAYTWAKMIDDGSVSGAGAAGQASNSVEEANPYDVAADRGLSNYDIRNNVTANVLIALPFHQNRLVDGWQVSTIATLHSGVPVNLLSGYNEFDEVYPLSDEHPNSVPGCNVHVGKVNEWFNPNCFSLPAVGYLGNVGRDTVIGPGVLEFDSGLTKNTRISEGWSAQFRAEAFNISNRANFALPSSSLFNSVGVLVGGAGQITSTSTTSRQIQFSLKILF